ncbi:MAG: DUF5719 family protein [Actinomycetota bacterium]|nr:DUF5719 family protein [Actinomycetota bacterium]
MRPRPGEALVGAALGILLLGGLGVDLWGPKVAAGPAADTTSPHRLFSARAVFCPAALEKPLGLLTLFAASSTGEDVTVGAEPGAEERTELAGDRILQHKPPGAGASDLVGYGGPVSGSAVTSVDEPVGGVGAAACSRTASTRWFFPEGNNTLTHDERLVVYNPFPDEAVVRVTLFTPGGEKARAGLSDVAVPSESAVTVDIKDFIVEQKILGALVTTVRGRVVAWRISIAEPEEKPSGLQFTLGATSARDIWYFPEGAVGAGYHERLSILNPGVDEAMVEISLTTAGGTVPAAGLTELPVPGRSTIAVTLDESMLSRRDRASGGGGVSVTVRSVNSVPVVAERTVFYATEDLDGVASEIGAPTVSEEWLLAPPTTRPETDAVVVLNPGSQTAEVSLALLRTGGDPQSPDRLRGLAVEPGARMRIPVGELTRGRAVAVLVSSTAPVVAERFSYSRGAGDVASLMGVPVGR